MSPKPVRKEFSDFNEPQANDPTFIPGYYCPECKKTTTKTSPSARPSIWHPECAPPKGTTRRLRRICPGCGRHHTLPPGPYVGQPTAFCTLPSGDPKPECKEAYKEYMNSLRERAPTGYLPEQDRYYCCTCTQFVVYCRFRRQYKARQCQDCFFTDQNRALPDKKQTTCRIPSCKEPVHEIDPVAKRERFCHVHNYRFIYFRSQRSDDNLTMPLHDYNTILAKTEFEEAPGDDDPMITKPMNPNIAPPPGLTAEQAATLDQDFMSLVPDEEDT